ncbi:MAG TPA: ATPase inhibitor subunit zeta [Candidatus Omnitrophota bacterium]|nr:ATPase inhibitor subunit zeta [Candidatus Omnitrophota bacterium]
MAFEDAMSSKGQVSQARFVHENETRFWVRARRNRLLAEWACDLTDETSQAYLRLLLDEDFARRDSEGILLLKIKNDLAGFGVFLPIEEIKDMCDRFERQAWLEMVDERR